MRFYLISFLILFHFHFGHFRFFRLRAHVCSEPYFLVGLHSIFYTDYIRFRKKNIFSPTMFAISHFYSAFFRFFLLFITPNKIPHAAQHFPSKKKINKKRVPPPTRHPPHCNTHTQKIISYFCAANNKQSFVQ